MNEVSLLSTAKLRRLTSFSFLLLLGLFIFSCNSKTYPTVSETSAQFDLEGIVFDQIKELPLEGVEIVLENDCAKESSTSILTDATGKYYFKLESNCCYNIRAFKEGYNVEESNQCTKDLTESTTLQINLNLSSVIVPVYSNETTVSGSSSYSTTSGSYIEPGNPKISDTGSYYSDGSSYSTHSTSSSTATTEMSTVSTMSNGKAAVTKKIKKASLKAVKKEPVKEDTVENVTEKESNEEASTKSLADSKDCFQEKYGKGLVAFDTIPDKMIKDQLYSFKIKIDHMHNLEETIKKIEEKEGIDVEYNVDDLRTERGLVIGSKGMLPLGDISKYVNFVVTADDPEAFSIVDRYKVGFQEIDCVKPAIWQYDITPLKEGKHKVYFNVYLSEDGKTPIPHEGGKEKIIDVEIIKAEESFLSKYTLPLSGGFLGLLFLGLYLFKRRKKLAEKEVITSAITAQDILKMESLVEKGEVDKALSLMTKKIPDHNNKIRQEALLCLRNYNKLTKNYSMGIVSFDDYSQQSSALSLAVIQLISELKSTLTADDV